MMPVRLLPAASSPAKALLGYFREANFRGHLTDSQRIAQSTELTLPPLTPATLGESQ
jgi:hypothetical protein